MMKTEVPAMPKRKAAPAMSARPGGGAFLARGNAETFLDGVFVAFTLFIAWLPLVFGSNYLWAWGVNAVALGALLAVYEAGRLALGLRAPVAFGRIGWLFAGFALLLGWIALQVVTWVPQDWVNAYWSLASDILATVPGAEPVRGSISIAPDAGVVGLVRLLSTAAAFYLAVQLLRDRLRAEYFLIALVGMSVVYALFGICQMVFFPATGLWQSKTAYPDDLTSTFINRNNYATYAGMGLIAAFGLVIDLYRRVEKRRNMPFRYHALAMLEVSLRRGVWLVLCIFIIAVALLLTHSRGGVGSSLLGLFSLILCVALFTRRPTLALSVGAPVLIVIVAALLVYGDGLMERVAAGTEGQRREVMAWAFQGAQDAWSTGFGYESFSRIIPVYREAGHDIHLTWDKAHNTYIELLSDIGFPAAILATVLVLGFYGLLVRNLLGRERSPMFVLIGLGVSVQVFVHALLDFSLQIQAVTITFWVLLGGALAQSWSSRVDTSQ